LNPNTPLDVLSCLMTGIETEQARIGTHGLYLATYLAILPVSVITIIKSSPRSRTVETAAEAIDSEVARG
jgi:hypothetical protein